MSAFLSQTVDRECSPLTMCQIADVLCHVSNVSSRVSIGFFGEGGQWGEVVELVGEGSVINEALPFFF